jgi:hypothetical protein
MQIRQLEALQAMARTSGSKVVFGASSSEAIPVPSRRDFLLRKCWKHSLTVSVPMNLGTMGAAGMDNVAHQMAASARHDDEHGPGLATNAGLISSMANV